jgi:predicted metal-dependent phosphoesterase TrpH
MWATLAAWLVVLASLSLSGGRQPLAHDVIADADVTHRYQLTLAPLRVALDPICGIAFHACSREAPGLWSLLLLGVLGRLGWALLRRTARRHGATGRLDRLGGALQRALAIGFATSLVVGALAVGALTWLEHTDGRLVAEAAILRTAHAAIWVCLAGYAVFLLGSWVRVLRGCASAPRARGVIRRVGSELAGLCGFVVLGLCLNFALISLPLPTWRVETDLAPGEVLADLHSHSTFSDGWLSPAQRVRWYERQGVTVFAVSDHHHTLGAAAARQYADASGLPVTALSAFEYTSDAPFVHLTVFGTRSGAAPTWLESGRHTANGDSGEAGAPRLPVPALDAAGVIAWAHAQRAPVIAAHWHRRPGIPSPSPEELVAWGVDGFEVTNETMEAYDLDFSHLVTLCRQHGLAAVSVSDSHENRPITRFNRVRLEPGEAVTIASLFAALARNEHEAVAIDPHPSPWRLPPALDVFQPLAAVATYLRDISWPQRLSWALWSLGVFALLLWMVRAASRDAADQGSS